MKSGTTSRIISFIQCIITNKIIFAITVYNVFSKHVYNVSQSMFAMLSYYITLTIHDYEHVAFLHGKNFLNLVLVTEPNN